MRSLTDAELVASILARCDQSGGPASCWPWRGRWTHAQGYGLVTWRGKSATASRVVCCVTRGLAPEDVPQTRHTCDFPPCCNPEHVIPGTAAQNAADKDERGRRPARYRPHTRIRKLTDDQVRAIRADTRPLGAIANQHHISFSVISRIRNGKSKALVKG